MYSHPVVIDCDPGHDDAIALMLALGHLDVRGVTTVGGNALLADVTRNALNLLEVMQRSDVPVFAGFSGPLVGDIVTAPQFHGASGLDGPRLGPPTTTARDEHAADFLIRTAREEADRGLTIVATGPLTNVAAALHRAPDIAPLLAEISIMGGSATMGNWTPAAEFNIVVDPEAAAAVFRSGVPIRMSGLNLTRQCAYGEDKVAEIAGIPTRTAEVAAELLRFFMGSAAQEISLREATLHDACAVAWLIRPDLVVDAPAHVDVELQGRLTRGMTVCDLRHLRSAIPLFDIAEGSVLPPRGSAPNARVGLRFDLDGFHELLLSTLAQLP